MCADFYGADDYEKFRTHQGHLSLARAVVARDRTLVRARAKCNFHVPKAGPSVTARAGLFRHVVMFRWKKAVRDPQIDALHEALDEMRAKIATGIVNFLYGDDAVGGKEAYDFVLVVDFESYRDYQVYANHPAHRELSMKLLGPMIRERAGTQFYL